MQGRMEKERKRNSERERESDKQGKKEEEEGKEEGAANGSSYNSFGEQSFTAEQIFLSFFLTFSSLDSMERKNRVNE